MKLRKVQLTNFRCFSSFELDLDETLTVIVAQNGAGKTAILDAIATGLGYIFTRLPNVSGINFKKTDFLITPEGTKPAYMRISFESTGSIKWDRTEKRDSASLTTAQIPEAFGFKALNVYVDQFINAYNNKDQFTLPVFIYYGTGRGVFDIPQKRRNFRREFLRFESLEGALEAKASFRRFFEYFYFLEELERRDQKDKRDWDYEQPELKTIRRAIQKAMPGFSNPRSELRPLRFMVDWNTDNEIKSLRIDQLSDGYRTTLAMIMDIASRMAEANPEMEDPLQTEGIILIDEVDMHLHPGWQQTIIKSLTDTFPNIQFIVTTHSPQILTTVASSKIKAIKWVDNIPHLIPVDFSEGAESQRVLEDILGVNPRPQNIDIVKKLNRYLELVSLDQWDSEEALKLRLDLDKWGDMYEPVLKKADIDIRLRVRRRTSK